MILTAFSDGRFIHGDRELRCALGRSGVIEADAKREGDGASPLGRWPIRRALWRPDRLDRSETVLPVQPIGADDGWCDDPADRAYNRPVRLPYPARHEIMRREDALYDVVVILGHNDDPPVPGLGSAIFLHCAKPGWPPTEGCVALDRTDLLAVLAEVRPGDVLEIAR